MLIKHLRNKPRIPLRIKEPTPENEKPPETNLSPTPSSDSTRCSRTKSHLLEVGDKISSFSMECSNRINRCANWFCTRNINTSTEHRPSSPSADVTQGPGPSPGSSGSCDDSQPPPRNCYRLVMLGYVFSLTLSNVV